MMQPLVVSDANIFIDLWQIDLLEEFFQLPLKIHTTDYVIDELTKGDIQTKILYYSDHKKLIIQEFDGDESEAISDIYNNQNGLSYTDCSVLFLAQKNECKLLTGDNKLNRVATKEGIDVHGLLHVFDLLVEEHQILPPQKAVQCLKSLISSNARLPVEEVESRIKKWQNKK
ncbi:MAG: PIN domain-containing protein [Verrucomicrobiae bacterium]|nr:PIN domain-containing protein [Verrucomicrobiae bacterium]